MTLHDSCIADNARQRQRLQSLGACLTDDDLRRSLPNGWTIAETLAHLAFWDQYFVGSLQKWTQERVVPSPTDAAAVNAAVQWLSSALPPRAAAQLALDAAERVDDVVAKLQPEFLLQVEQAGRIRAVHRALHRKEHLDRIEHMLGQRATL